MVKAMLPFTVKAAKTKRTVTLTVLVVVQLLCALAILIIDMSDDIIHLSVLGELLVHDITEFTVVGLLFLSIVLMVLELRRMRAWHSVIEERLMNASAAFRDVLEDHFDAWRLTPAERDAAHLIIQGMSISQIAETLQTSEPVIEVQCRSIRDKAETTGRSQVFGGVIEDLLNARLGGSGIPGETVPRPAGEYPAPGSAA